MQVERIVFSMESGSLRMTVDYRDEAGAVTHTGFTPTAAIETRITPMFTSLLTQAPPQSPRARVVELAQKATLTPDEAAEVLAIIKTRFA